MTEWGIFNDESEDYTADEAIEAGFYSREEAEKALTERYSEDDDAEVQVCAEPEED
jgi:hypothetical protein